MTPHGHELGETTAPAQHAAAAADSADRSTPRRRLRRTERREQILAAATRAFARSGFSATGLDDIAAEAGISRAILYRHFDSKSDLYRAVLDRACDRLIASVGADEFTEDSIPALVRAAADEPDGFRLLFRYATREAEFRDRMAWFNDGVVEVARRNLSGLIPDPGWEAWAAHLVPTVAIEAVIAWLDAGQPDPAAAARRIAAAVDGVIQAARCTDSRGTGE
ncbi:TetR/AcrR family transcriptional regulator [Nocardiopsis gilva YIM 90087]|uniref:TetR/AcrR family transcriptional regulator n=1 Tax=Nocardiopsis gilva YIM 90087 TaxID=1235441 RepID=A0A223S6Y7_9ACTN|nr:TetR/AcrR family transcriptional regulator [Nocardiopsis gilva]ASU83885.1 TetR/AcrR family transcriptional regulator [Nocardiopsis gilva YIM 90087]